MRPVVAAVAALGFCGCGALGQFDTTIAGDGEIPGQLQMGTGAFGAGSFDAAGSLQQTFNSKGTSANHISSAKITGGTLSVTNTSQTQNNLAYIQSFELDVSADGQPTVPVAQIPASAFANRATSAQLTVNPVELKPYIASGSLTMTPKIVFKSYPAQPVPIHLSVTVHIVPSL